MVHGETVTACLENHAKYSVGRTQSPCVLKPVIHAVTVTSEVSMLLRISYVSRVLIGGFVCLQTIGYLWALSSYSDHTAETEIGRV
jgi:hypothetical protein